MRFARRSCTDGEGARLAGVIVNIHTNRDGTQKHIPKGGAHIQKKKKKIQDKINFRRGYMRIFSFNGGKAVKLLT